MEIVFLWFFYLPATLRKTFQDRFSIYPARASCRRSSRSDVLATSGDEQICTPSQSEFSVYQNFFPTLPQGESPQRSNTSTQSAFDRLSKSVKLPLIYSCLASKRSAVLGLFKVVLIKSSSSFLVFQTYSLAAFFCYFCSSLCTWPWQYRDGSSFQALLSSPYPVNTKNKNLVLWNIMAFKLYFKFQCAFLKSFFS